MKKTIYRQLKLFLMVFVFVIVCACSDENKGACVIGSGIGAGCGDDYTSGQCSTLNGRFHEGKSCADLGFTSG